MIGNFSCIPVHNYFGELLARALKGKGLRKVLVENLVVVLGVQVAEELVLLLERYLELDSNNNRFGDCMRRCMGPHMRLDRESCH